MFYINWTLQSTLSLCALRKYDCFGLELTHWRRKPQKSSCMYHNPCACALSCLCCECRRPQQAATVRCLEWADVYSPSYRVLKDMGWHVAAVQPACLTDWLHSHIPSVRRHLWRGWAMVCYLLSLCLALSFINTVAGTDTRKKAGFSPRSKHCVSSDNECKDNKV